MRMLSGRSALTSSEDSACQWHPALGTGKLRRLRLSMLPRSSGFGVFSVRSHRLNVSRTFQIFRVLLAAAVVLAPVMFCCAAMGGETAKVAAAAHSMPMQGGGHCSSCPSEKGEEEPPPPSCDCGHHHQVLDALRPTTPSFGAGHFYVLPAFSPFLHPAFLPVVSAEAAPASVRDGRPPGGGDSLLSLRCLLII